MPHCWISTCFRAISVVLTAGTSDRPEPAACAPVPISTAPVRAVVPTSLSRSPHDYFRVAVARRRGTCSTSLPTLARSAHAIRTGMGAGTAMTVQAVHGLGESARPRP
jgi:hypothetical protein